MSAASPISPFNAPQRSHQALFTTVRAGDEQQSYASPSAGASSSPPPSPAPAGSSKDINKDINASEDPSATTTKASTQQQRALASAKRREANSRALKRVVLQSLADNEEVERRIVLEREITERHQLVVMGLNGGTNALYKTIVNGPLKMTVEERAGLRVHQLDQSSGMNASIGFGGGESAGRSKNGESKREKKSKSADDDDVFVTDLVQSLSPDEKKELRSLLSADVRLATSLVDVYKSVVGERKALGAHGSDAPPPPPAATTTASSYRRGDDGSIESRWGTANAYEQPLRDERSTHAKATAAPPAPSGRPHHTSSHHPSSTPFAPSSTAGGRPTTAAGQQQRALLVQSLIASMSDVLPADLLGTLSYDANAEAERRDRMAREVAGQQYHSNSSNNNKDHAYLHHNGGHHQQQQQHAVVAAMASGANNVPLSSRQVADSVYALYKALGTFYTRVRTVEAFYLARKWDAVERRRRRELEEDEAAELREQQRRMYMYEGGGEIGESEEQKAEAAAARLARRHRREQQRAAVELPVTGASVIIASFFTRLLGLDDPLAHTNYLDRLLRHGGEGGGASANEGNDKNNNGSSPLLARNDFYALPRRDRTLDVPPLSPHSGGIKGNGAAAAHFSELCASAAELGTLLLDEAAQIVTEHPPPAPLPYDAYGALGRYAREQEALKRDTATERRLMNANAERYHSERAAAGGGGGGGAAAADRSVVGGGEGAASASSFAYTPSSPLPASILKGGGDPMGQYHGSPSSAVQFTLSLAPPAGSSKHKGGGGRSNYASSVANNNKAAEEAAYSYPCSLDVADALPYTAFSSYVRTIAGALYPDRSALVSSQLLAMTLSRRTHLLIL